MIQVYGGKNPIVLYWEMMCKREGTEEGTAQSVEDVTRNAEVNGNRNPDAGSQNIEIWKIRTHFSSFESGKVVEKLIRLPREWWVDFRQELIETLVRSN